MKSHERGILELATCIYKDAVAKCTANQLEERDLLTLQSRIEHEGLSFVTITLPSLAKDLELSLSQGQIASQNFRGFRKFRKIPAFLRGFFKLVFDSSTGRLLNEPSIEAIEGIRQIGYTFKKLEVPCSPQREKQAFTDFIQIEQELAKPIAPDYANVFNNVSSVVWSSMLSSAKLCERYANRPRHGPGATAERIQGNEKYTVSRWHDRLEPYFPLITTAFNNENVYGSAEFECVTVVSEECEQPVRVISVPKTLKAPRIIAIEPVCMQYTQQSISQALVEAIEHSVIAGGHVNFRDQTVNQRMAISASASGEYATLDLSSASDRVPYSVAIRMFDCNPELQGAVAATRTTRAQMPDGSILELKKFASMGSALCFPVEAMYFYTICIAALLRKYKLPVTFRNCYAVSRNVYVYGDDIIIPTHDAEFVIQHLHDHMCKVQTSKSFWTGKFRESCGADAYDGVVVTPTYVKKTCPNDIGDASSLTSWVAASNSFYKRGYWQTASYLMKRCEAIMGTLPIVGPRCAGLGKVSFQNLVSSERWNKGYQVFEVKTWCQSPVYRQDKLEGHGALLKCLLKAGSEEPSDAKHLERSVRHGAVALKRRWVRPY